MPKIIKKNKDIVYYIQNFIDFCKYKELSTKTIKSYYQTLTLFAKYLEEEKEIFDIQKVNKEIVEEYIEFTKSRGKYSYVADEKSIETTYQNNRRDLGDEISAATLNNYLRNIKVFFNFLYDNDFIKYNDVKKVKHIKTKRVIKEQLTDDEYKKLVKSLDITNFHEYRDYVIIQLIFDTGMRLGECLSLEIENIDLMNKTIFLSAEVTKGKKDRYVFFSQKMKELLGRWIRYKDAIQENDLIFPTTRTNRMLTASNFERNFRIYLKRARIKKKITPHTLRNNFGRRFLLNGGDIFMLSKILGHSSVTVTEKAYLDLTTEDIRRKYRKYSPLENMN